MDSSIPAKYLVASVLLHALCVLFLSRQFLSTRLTPLEETFTVDTISASELARLQRRNIVSPPQNKETTSPTKDAFLSDKDRTTAKESIKRGEPATGPSAPQASTKATQPPAKVSQPKPQQPKKEEPTQQKAQPPKPQQSQRQSQQGARSANTKETGAPAATSEVKPSPPKKDLRYLTLDRGEALERFGENSSPRSRPAQPQAFSRPPGSGAAFQGEFGTQDYLPHLPDGDLTLLNTKASTFAVFVRRVALRVFQSLKQSGWETLSARQIGEIRGNVMVEAKLSKSGELLSVKTLSSSGSGSYDRTVERAVRKAAADPHPPPGAEAADGTITFRFASRTWSRARINPQTKAPFEQRWIFLGTGLE